MNSNQLKALLLFISGAATAMTGAALVREAPGTKSYYVHKLDVTQTPLADGGSDIEAKAFTTVTLGLSDGGTDVVDLGGISCPLTPANTNTLRNILNAASNCAKTAP